MSHAVALSTVKADAHSVRQGGQIYGLDMIRFVAACLVMGHHLGFAIWAGESFPATYRYLGPFTWFGFIGVEIFFVLSGFIIAYTAETSSPLRFFANRFIRLYPTAWVCSLITVAALILSRTEHFGSDLVKEWVRSAVFYPHGLYVDGSYWTLSIEISFYCVIFALLLTNCFRLLGRTMSLIGIVSSSSWIYFGLAQQSLIHPHSLGERYVRLMTYQWKAHLLLLDYGCYFTLGSLLWLCLMRKATLSRILVLTYCLMGSLIEVYYHSIMISNVYRSHYSLIVPEVIYLSGLTAIILSVYRNATLGKWLSPKQARLARNLGLVTYPLYLIHQSIGYLLIHILHPFVPDIVALSFAVLILIASSFAIHALLEKPLQTLLRRLLDPPPRAVPATASLP